MPHAQTFNRTIDFTHDFAAREGAKPHSSVVLDLTDPSRRQFGY